MSITEIQDSGGGVLNNKFIQSAVNKYLTLAFLCLTTLSTVGLAISTGVLDQKYKLLRNGYIQQSNTLSACLKQECSSGGDCKHTGASYYRFYLNNEWKYIRFNTTNGTFMSDDEVEELLTNEKAYYTLDVIEDGGLVLDAVIYDGEKPSWGSINTSKGIDIYLDVRSSYTAISMNKALISDLDGIYVGGGIQAAQYGVQVYGGIETDNTGGIGAFIDTITINGPQSNGIRINTITIKGQGSTATSIGKIIDLDGSIDDNGYDIMLDGLTDVCPQNANIAGICEKCEESDWNCLQYSRQVTPFSLKDDQTESETTSSYNVLLPRGVLINGVVNKALMHGILNMTVSQFEHDTQPIVGIVTLSSNKGINTPFDNNIELIGVNEQTIQELQSQKLQKIINIQSDIGSRDIHIQGKVGNILSTDSIGSIKLQKNLDQSSPDVSIENIDIETGITKITVSDPTQTAEQPFMEIHSITDSSIGNVTVGCVKEGEEKPQLKTVVGHITGQSVDNIYTPKIDKIYNVDNEYNNATDLNTIMTNVSNQYISSINIGDISIEEIGTDYTNQNPDTTINKIGKIVANNISSINVGSVVVENITKEDSSTYYFVNRNITKITLENSTVQYIESINNPKYSEGTDYEYPIGILTISSGKEDDNNATTTTIKQIHPFGIDTIETHNLSILNITNNDREAGNVDEISIIGGNVGSINVSHSQFEYEEQTENGDFVKKIDIIGGNIGNITVSNHVSGNITVSDYVGGNITVSKYVTGSISVDTIGQSTQSGTAIKVSQNIYGDIEIGTSVDQTTGQVVGNILLNSVSNVQTNDNTVVIQGIDTASVNNITVKGAITHISSDSVSNVQTNDNTVVIQGIDTASVNNITVKGAITHISSDSVSNVQTNDNTVVIQGIKTDSADITKITVLDLIQEQEHPFTEINSINGCSIENVRIGYIDKQGEQEKQLLQTVLAKISDQNISQINIGNITINEIGVKEYNTEEGATITIYDRIGDIIANNISSIDVGSVNIEDITIDNIFNIRVEGTIGKIKEESTTTYQGGIYAQMVSQICNLDSSYNCVSQITGIKDQNIDQITSANTITQLTAQCITDISLTGSECSQTGINLQKPLSLLFTDSQIKDITLSNTSVKTIVSQENQPQLDWKNFLDQPCFTYSDPNNSTNTNIFYKISYAQANSDSLGSLVCNNNDQYLNEQIAVSKLIGSFSFGNGINCVNVSDILYEVKNNDNQYDINNCGDNTINVSVVNTPSPIGSLTVQYENTITTILDIVGNSIDEITITNNTVDTTITNITTTSINTIDTHSLTGLTITNSGSIEAGNVETISITGGNLGSITVQPVQDVQNNNIGGEIKTINMGSSTITKNVQLGIVTEDASISVGSVTNDIVVTGSVGSINAGSVTNNIVVTNSAASISVGSVGGISVSNVTNDIVVTDSVGSINITNSANSINVGSVGSINITNSADSINVGNVGSVNAGSVSGQFSTSGSVGSINVSNVTNDIVVTDSVGNINITNSANSINVGSVGSINAGSVTNNIVVTNNVGGQFSTSGNVGSISVSNVTNDIIVTNSTGSINITNSANSINVGSVGNINANSSGSINITNSVDSINVGSVTNDIVVTNNVGGQFSTSGSVGSINVSSVTNDIVVTNSASGINAGSVTNNIVVTNSVGGINITNSAASINVGSVGGDNTVQAISINGPIKCLGKIGEGGCVQLKSIDTNSGDALVVQEYINSNNGSSTAINIQGLYSEITDTNYAVLGTINILGGVFSSDETAINIGQDNTGHTQIVGNISLPGIIGGVQVGRSSSQYNNIIDQTIQQTTQVPITCIPVNIDSINGEPVTQYLINLTYLDQHHMSNEEFNQNVMGKCNYEVNNDLNTISSDILVLVQEYLDGSKKQPFKFEQIQIPGYRISQYNNTFIIYEQSQIDCTLSDYCQYIGDDIVIDIDTSIFVTKRTQTYDKTSIYNTFNNSGISVKDGINSINGVAVNINGSITARDKAIYVGGDINSQDVVGDNIYTDESNSTSILRLEDLYAGVVVNGNINVHGNPISVNGSVYTDLTAYEKMPTNASSYKKTIHPKEIGAIVVNKSVISGQYTKKLFYNITDVECFNFTYNSNTLTLYDFTNYQDGDPLDPNNCQDISQYNITSDQLISAMLTFTSKTNIDEGLTAQLTSQPDLIFDSSFIATNNLAINFSASSSGKTLQYIFAYNKPTNNDFTNMIMVNLDKTQIGQYFLTSNNYQGISIVENVYSGGYGVYVKGNISAGSDGVRVSGNISAGGSGVYVNKDISAGGSGVYVNKDISAGTSGVQVGGDISSSGGNGVYVAGISSKSSGIYVGKGGISSKSSGIYVGKGGISSSGGSSVYVTGDISSSSGHGVYVTGSISSSSGNGVYVNGDILSSRNKGVYVNGSISSSSSVGVYVNGSISSDTSGIIVNGTIESYNNGIWINGELKSTISPSTSNYAGINITKSVTGYKTGILVKGYVEGKGSDNAIVQLGGINASNGTGQALSIGKTALSDGVSVKGSINIEGSILGGLSASCVNTITLLDGTCSTDFYNDQTNIIGIKGGNIGKVSIGNNIQIQNIDTILVQGIDNITVGQINIQQIVDGNINYISTQSISDLSAQTVTGSIGDLTCSSINTITISDPTATINTLTHGNTIINSIKDGNIESILTNGIGANNVSTAINVNGGVTCGDDGSGQTNIACIDINGQLTVQNTNSDAFYVNGITGNYARGIYVNQQITGATIQGVYVGGYIEGNVNSNDGLVYIGGINASNGTGQALFIGNTTLGDGLSVKGSINIDGNVVSQIKQPALNILGTIDNIKPADVTDPVGYSGVSIGGISSNDIALKIVNQVSSTNGSGVYIGGSIQSDNQGVYIGQVKSTNGYGVYVDDGIDSDSYAIYVTKKTTDSNPAIKSTSSSGIYVNGAISAKNSGVYVNGAISSSSGNGVSVYGAISSSNNGVYINGELKSTLPIPNTEKYAGINITNSVTGYKTGISVGGYVEGKGSDNAVVYLGGINASNGTGQALSIGNTTLGDGSSVKGSINIDGNVKSQLQQPALNILGTIDNIKPADVTSPVGYSGVSIGGISSNDVALNIVGQVSSTNGSGVYIEGSIQSNKYGVFVRDGIDSGDSAIYINKPDDTNIAIKSTSGSGIYVNGAMLASAYGVYVYGSISSGNNGVYVGNGVNSTSGSGIYVNGAMLASAYGVYVGNDVNSTSGSGIYVYGAISAKNQGVLIYRDISSSSSNGVLIYGDISSSGGSGVLVGGDISSSGGSGVSVNGDISSDCNGVYINGELKSTLPIPNTKNYAGINITKSVTGYKTGILVKGYVDGNVNDNAVVQLGGINASNGTGQALSIGNTTLSDGSSVKGSINIDGDILGAIHDNKANSDNDPDVYTLSVGGNIQGNVDTLNIVNGDLTSLSIITNTTPNTPGGNSGPIYIAGNVVENEGFGALIVDGYVQGSGSSNTVVQLGGISTNDGAGQALSIGNTALGDDGISVKGNINIEGNITSNDVGINIYGGILATNNGIKVSNGITSTDGLGIDINGGILAKNNGVYVTNGITSTDGSGIYIEGSISGKGDNTNAVVQLDAINAGDDGTGQALYIGDYSLDNGVSVKGSINIAGSILGAIHDNKANNDPDVYTLQIGDIYGNVNNLNIINGDLTQLTVSNTTPNTGGNSGPIYIAGNVVHTGMTGSLMVGGYVQGNGDGDNAVVQLGGINADGGSGQALYIGNTALGDDMSVKGTITIEGNIISQRQQPTLTVSGSIEQTMSGCNHNIVCSGIYIGSVQSYDTHDVYLEQPASIRNGADTSICPRY